MAENSNKEQIRDYRARFEFVLTVGDNIICQRYFHIYNFNQNAFRSFELPNTLQYCANLIDQDLKSKTQIYLESYAPKVFNNEEEATRYFENPENVKEMVLGEGIVFRDSDKNFFWGGEKGILPSQYKYDDGEFSTLSDDSVVRYKLSFYDNGKEFEQHREVCSVVWDGIYPRFVRNQIDLSNRKYRYDGEDLSRISYEQSLLYKMSEGKGDLVWRIIKEICNTCSATDEWYTLMEPINKKGE